jgi:hypothetical protein
VTEQRQVLVRLSDRTIVVIILVIALLARLPLAFFEFARHPDEIWQYLEPAYRLDFGRGIVTWEYRSGIRSWLIPSLLAGPLAAGKLLLGNTPFSITPLRLCLLAMSLIIVWAGMRIAGRVSRLHAIVTGLALAIAFEPILMATRALSETIGTVFLVGAAVPLTGRNSDRRGWLLGGVLLGLTVSARVQFGPAAATLAVLSCRTDWRKWLWVSGGGALGLGIDGLVDALCGEVPLRWMVENFRLNLVSGVSARWGVEPASWYLTHLAEMWGLALPFILFFIVIGARRQPVLFAVALVNLLIHSLIPHKEFRFIFPTVVLLTIVAALGSADVLQWIWQRAPRWRWPAIVGTGAIWAASSASAAMHAKAGHAFAYHSEAAMWRAIHSAPKICGVASFDLPEPAMAYVYVDRPIPVYFFGGGNEDALLRHAYAFDWIAAGQLRESSFAPAGYRLSGCFADHGEAAAGPAAPRRLCLFQRAGGCTPTGAEQYLENNVLRSGGN